MNIKNWLSRRKNGSSAFRSRLILTLALTSIIPLLLLSAYFYYTVDKMAIKQAEENGMSEAMALKQETLNMLQQQFSVLTLLAGTPAINNFSKTNLDKDIKALLVQGNKTMPDLNPVILTDTTGQQLLRSDAGAPVQVADRNYFIEAIHGTNKQVVSELLLSKSNGHNIVTLAVPIIRQEKEVVGLVNATVDLERLKDFVTKLSTNGHTAFILDRDGKVIGHPDNNMIMKNYNEEPFFQSAKNGDLSTVITNLNGNKVLLAPQYDPLSQWYIYTEIPYAEISQKGDQLLQQVIAAAIVLFIILIIVGYLVSGVTARSIGELMKVATKIANGDLRARVHLKDKTEIGKLGDVFNQMAASIGNIIGQARESALQVASSSQQLLAGAEQTSKATEYIATSMEGMAKVTERQITTVKDTAQNVEEMSKGVSIIVEHSQSASQAANHATLKSSEGAQAVGNVVAQMSSINDTVTTLATDIRDLGSRSKEISQIVMVITDIAQRTNLLALNAGIEAARAGEHGKGFAVVAVEVKKLAEQAGNSAAEIVTLIETILAGTERSNNSLDSALSEVNMGLQAVQAAGAIFEEIEHSTNEVTGKIHEVSIAAEQISDGTKRVVEAIAALTEVASNTDASVQSVSAATEQQLATMQEVSASSKALTSLADGLQQVVDKFEV